MFLKLWILCTITLAGALAITWVGYRLKSLDSGLNGAAREVAILLCVGVLEAICLFLVWRIVGWTHWLQYMVAAVIGGLGYKVTHVSEMDEYQPFVIGITQLILFWPTLIVLGPYLGRLARRFPAWG